VRASYGDAAALSDKADTMAQKQPAKDAVSAAMSAIENALNLSDDGHEPAATPPDSSSGRSAALPPPIEPPARRLSPSDDVKSPLVADPPANDDRAAIGPILQALAVGRPTLAPVIAPMSPFISPGAAAPRPCAST
jgi:hypothetical protein